MKTPHVLEILKQVQNDVLKIKFLTFFAFKAFAMAYCIIQRKTGPPPQHHIFY